MTRGHINDMFLQVDFKVVLGWMEDGVINIFQHISSSDIL